MSSKRKPKVSDEERKRRRMLNHKDLKDIPKEKIQEFLECFEMFDQNGDGVITSEEMVIAMKGLGHNPTRREVAEMLGIDPTKGDGKISFPEFCKHLNEMPEERETPESLVEAFKVFDRDNDGFITAVELKEAMQTLGDGLTEKEAEDRIKQADKDGDGKIDLTEFSKLIQL